MQPDLFANDPSEDPARIARLRLPPIRKASNKALLDFELESERKAHSRKMDKRSDTEHRRDRILAARAAIKAATPRKARKKKGGWSECVATD